MIAISHIVSSFSKKQWCLGFTLVMATICVMFGFFYYNDIKDYQKWRDYFARTVLSDPHPLIVHYIHQKQFTNPSTVKILDLGAGNETLHLLSRGFNVYAVDFHQTAISRIQHSTLHLKNPKLTLIKKSFQDISWQALPKFDVVIAINSISFVPGNVFYRLWQNISNQLNPGGILIVRLFGDKFKWSNMHAMTLLSKNTTMELIKTYEVISFKEIYEKKQETTQHAFEVVLRKISPLSDTSMIFHPLISL